MTTSGSYDNTTTGYTLVKDAYVLAGMVDEGEPLSAEQWVSGKRILNEMMSLLSIHKGLWLVDDITITLTPGTTSYTIAVGDTVDQPTPMRVTHARSVYSTTHHIPMEVVSREDYMGIPNKILQSPALQVYYDKGHGELYVWPTGTSTYKTIIITAQRPVQDFDDQGNTPDFPKEWTLAIKYNLAEMLAPGANVSPMVSQKAKELLATVAVFDGEETSLYIR